MPSTSLHISEGLSPHLPLGPEPLRVMLVTGGGRRRWMMKACIDRQAPGCRIDVVDSCFDAMARAGRMPAHLMVLDLTLDSVLVPALKQYLSRTAPQVALHVFDDSRDPVTSTDSCPPSVLRLQADLQAFIDARLAQDGLDH